MSDSPERPLVTFAVLAYKQERFIREAIEGAFAQTYSPLEIVLSDDCSTDRTFAIMKEMADSYKGPHKVILNQNSKNLGIREHVNFIFSTAKSDWIVMAAGDDVSVPSRTASLMAVASSGVNITAVGSAFDLIDAVGRITPLGKSSNCLRTLNEAEDFHVITGRQLKGATAMWSRRLFEEFGPIKQPADFEDVVLTIRGILLGTVVELVNMPLVKWRTVGVTSKQCGFSVWEAEMQQIYVFNGLKKAASALDSDIVRMATRNPVTACVIRNLRSDTEVLDTCINWWGLPAEARKAITTGAKPAAWPEFHWTWLQRRRHGIFAFQTECLYQQCIFYCKYWAKKWISGIRALWSDSKS